MRCAPVPGFAERKNGEERTGESACHWAYGCGPWDVFDVRLMRVNQLHLQGGGSQRRL